MKNSRPLWIKVFGLGSLLLIIMPDLIFADDITITTYYPAPYGVYKEFKTTGDTHLATDSGSSVGIGTETPGSAKVKISGGTLDVDGQKIINLGTPTAVADATTKAYVDAAGGGGCYIWCGEPNAVDWLNSCPQGADYQQKAWSGAWACRRCADGGCYDAEPNDVLDYIILPFKLNMCPAGYDRTVAGWCFLCCK